jgi:Alpha amylase, catalytic domain
MMDNFTAESEDKQPRVLITEAYAEITQQILWYGSDEDNHGAHWPVNTIFISKLNEDSTADDFKNATADWMDAMPPWAKPNWMLGTQDSPRVASRFNPNRHESLAIMSLMLPGPNSIYYVSVNNHRQDFFRIPDFYSRGRKF